MGLNWQGEVRGWGGAGRVSTSVSVRGHYDVLRWKIVQYSTILSSGYTIIQE